MTLANDADIAWPEDCALYLVKKQKGVTVLDEIEVGKVEPKQ